MTGGKGGLGRSWSVILQPSLHLDESHNLLLPHWWFLVVSVTTALISLPISFFLVQEKCVLKSVFSC